MIEEVVPNSKFFGQSSETIWQSKIRAPLLENHKTNPKT